MSKIINVSRDFAVKFCADWKNEKLWASADEAVTLGGVTFHKGGSRQAYIESMGFGDNFQLALAGTRTLFEFHVDGTVRTINLPRNYVARREPLHLESIDSSRKVVGCRFGRVIYA